MMIKVFISNREKQTFSNLQDEYIYLLTLFCLGFLRMARLGGEGGGGGKWPRPITLKLLMRMKLNLEE